MPVSLLPRICWLMWSQGSWPCRFWRICWFFGGNGNFKPPSIPTTIHRRGWARCSIFAGVNSLNQSSLAPPIGTLVSQRPPLNASPIVRCLLQNATTLANGSTLPKTKHSTCLVLGIRGIKKGKNQHVSRPSTKSCCHLAGNPEENSF